MMAYHAPDLTLPAAAQVEEDEKLWNDAPPQYGCCFCCSCQRWYPNVHHRSLKSMTLIILAQIIMSLACAANLATLVDCQLVQVASQPEIDPFLLTLFEPDEALWRQEFMMPLPSVYGEENQNDEPFRQRTGLGFFFFQDVDDLCVQYQDLNNYQSVRTNFTVADDGWLHEYKAFLGSDWERLRQLQLVTTAGAIVEWVWLCLFSFVVNSYLARALWIVNLVLCLVPLQTTILVRIFRSTEFCLDYDCQMGRSAWFAIIALISHLIAVLLVMLSTTPGPPPHRTDRPADLSTITTVTTSIYGRTTDGVGDAQEVPISTSLIEQIQQRPLPHNVNNGVGDAVEVPISSLLANGHQEQLLHLTDPHSQQFIDNGVGDALEVSVSNLIVQEHEQQQEQRPTRHVRHGSSDSLVGAFDVPIPIVLVEQQEQETNQIQQVTSNSADDPLEIPVSSPLPKVHRQQLNEHARRARKDSHSSAGEALLLEESGRGPTQHLRNDSDNGIGDALEIPVSSSLLEEHQRQPRHCFNRGSNHGVWDCPLESIASNITANERKAPRRRPPRHRRHHSDNGDGKSLGFPISSLLSEVNQQPPTRHSRHRSHNGIGDALEIPVSSLLLEEHQRQPDHSIIRGSNHGVWDCPLESIASNITANERKAPRRRPPRHRRHHSDNGGGKSLGFPISSLLSEVNQQPPTRHLRHRSHNGIGDALEIPVSSLLLEEHQRQPRNCFNRGSSHGVDPYRRYQAWISQTTGNFGSGSPPHHHNLILSLVTKIRFAVVLHQDPFCRSTALANEHATCTTVWGILRVWQHSSAMRRR